ncbi:MAG: sigma-54 dependent transcriptional regulator [Desulfobacteraceae bacterium]|jgi:two-component system response regulator AtoC
MKILIVDDQPATLESLGMYFSENGYEVDTAMNGRSSIEKVKSFSPDIVILDIRLPDSNGIDVLKKMREMNEDIVVFMITAFHDMETTIKAMKYGAYDYVHKPIDIRELAERIGKVSDRIAVRNRLSYSGKTPRMKPGEGSIIGESKPMQEIFKMIGLCCNSQATVLIQGESGTGKDLIAKAIHYNSERREEPFVHINCGALVESLLESELFGHERGAFTHAFNDKVGKFEYAKNGTIFLDEVGEIQLSTQVKLLRFLQEKDFERVGSTVKITSNARVIAATNKDLSLLVRDGSFREDLYYRLKVINIEVPPLRERKSDIPLLIDYFFNKFFRERNRGTKRLSPEIVDKLIEYDWPGNVRELENFLMRVAVLNRDDILPEGRTSSIYATPGEQEEEQVDDAADFQPLEEMERRHIEKALALVGGHKGRACQLLKISRPTLNKKIKKYNLPA